MRIANIETLKKMNIRKKLTTELVRGIMYDIDMAGIVSPGSRELGKAIMIRINTFLMQDDCDRLPLDLGESNE